MLHGTVGNAIDFSEIKKSILEMRKVTNIKKIGYDRYLSPQFAEELTEQGVNMMVFPQTLGHFTTPTKEFEMLIKSGRVIIHKNPITRWMFDNCMLKEDHMGNQKPIKGSGRNAKIDGVISMVMALGTYMKDNKKEPSVDIIPVA